MNTYEKHNQSPFDDQLFKEQLGLERLRSLLKDSRNLYLRIPTVYAVTAKKLCLESIDHKIATQQQMHDFGHGLALMHQTVQRDYGLDHDNYIGLNRQKNGLWQEWGRFFVEQRLEQQLSLIQDKQLASTFQTQLNQNKESLIAFLNKHCDYSSLLHGDL